MTSNRTGPPLRTLLALTLLAAAGCGGSAEAPPPAGTDVIIFLSLDTLRADRTSLYGYERPTTPELERFAAEATLYRRVLAAAPWTLPSHASMFTGLYPYEHGARTVSLTDEEREAGISNAAPLDDSFLTLAEVLGSAGYRTAAFVANPSFLRPKYGLDQGFDRYGVAKDKVRDVNRRGLKWIDEQDGEPFFLFLNYMDTHRPYNTDPIDGFPRVGSLRKILKPLTQSLMSGGEVPPEWLATLNAEYDLSVANLDAGLGELFDALRERGIYDRALIVVTSDHGEHLGEHGLIEHAKDVYVEVVRVPLVVKAPHQTEPAVDEAWISHVHLPRLVLEHSRVPFTLPKFAQLSSNWPRGAVVAENYGARHVDLEKEWASRIDRLRRTYVDGDNTLIDSSPGERELYDLARDPGEREDLLGSHPAVPEHAARADELATNLAAWIAARREGPTAGRVKTEEAERNMLKELGYMGDDDD